MEALDGRVCDRRRTGTLNGWCDIVDGSEIRKCLTYIRHYTQNVRIRLCNNEQFSALTLIN